MNEQYAGELTNGRSDGADGLIFQRQNTSDALSLGPAPQWKLGSVRCASFGVHFMLGVSKIKIKEKLHD